MTTLNQVQDDTQLVNDAIALIKSGKEIPYLNLILKLNKVDPQELSQKEISLVKTPNTKTYTFTVGDTQFQIAEFIVNLMAKDYQENTIAAQKKV